MGVLIVERYVLARLRNRRFFSLFELNAAIRKIVVDLNTRIMLGETCVAHISTKRGLHPRALFVAPFQ